MTNSQWTFEGLKRNYYNLLMVDPPWNFKTFSEKGHTEKSAHSKYKCMSIDDIKSLPVADLAAENSILLLWTTPPMLPQAFGVLEAWGFRYGSMGAWHKKTVHGKTAFGTGYLLRSACEPWLIGVKGKPKNSRSHRNIFEGKVRQHSRKPEEAFEWCETYIEGPLCELFSRSERPGSRWATWGDEVGKW